MNLKNIFEKKKLYYYLGFIVLGFLALTSSPQNPATISESATPSVDTFIPRGFVLVPIEVQNFESLSSIVGELGGVVDLYTTRTADHPGGLKVGSRLKIIRAPLNPQQYAVLVPEGESHRLLAFVGPFSVVVQNPEENGARITTVEKKNSVRIHYQN